MIINYTNKTNEQQKQQINKYLKTAGSMQNRRTTNRNT